MFEEKLTTSKRWWWKLNIVGAAFVVTVCEFTVGVPSVGFVVLKVACRVFGVTAKNTEPGD